MQKVVDGPITTDFLVHQSNDRKQRVNRENPCNSGGSTTLQIRMSALLDSDRRRQEGYLKGDSMDGKFRQLLNIGWKKC